MTDTPNPLNPQFIEPAVTIPPQWAADSVRNNPGVPFGPVPADTPDDPPPGRYVGADGRTEAEEQHDQAPDDVAPERDEEAVAATPAAAPPRPEPKQPHYDGAEGLVAPPPRPDTSAPVPMAAGTYALYDDGSGGVVLVVATREGETHRKHLPAKVIRMGEMMMGGNNPLAAMFGGR